MTEAVFFTKPSIHHSSCAQAGAQIPQDEDEGQVVQLVAGPHRDEQTPTLTLKRSQLTSRLQTVGWEPDYVEKTHTDPPSVRPFANRGQQRVEVNTGKHSLCCQVTPSPFSAICLHLLMQQGIKKKRCSSYIIQNGPTAPLNESQAKKNTTTIFFFFFLTPDLGSKVTAV